MERDYLDDKSNKKKVAKDAFWILVIFIILFMAIITRFAVRSFFSNGVFSTMPSGEEAYKIAKNYIKPTLNSPDVVFADDDYKFAKDTDSVYVVKSYFEENDSANVKVKTNYTIKLKYIGGINSQEQSWSMLSLEEH
jgi:hypothetical protein